MRRKSAAGMTILDPFGSANSASTKRSSSNVVLKMSVRHTPFRYHESLSFLVQHPFMISAAIFVPRFQVELHLSDLSTEAIRSFRTSSTTRSQLALGRTAPPCTHSPWTFIRALRPDLWTFGLVRFFVSFAIRYAVFNADTVNLPTRPSTGLFTLEAFYAEYLFVP